jgi:hypothetical protein
MIGHALIIQTDGTHELTDFDKPPKLAFLQQSVGGFIETVPYFHSFVPPGSNEPVPCVAFCDEEGKLKDSPRLGINHEATQLWIKAYPHCDDILIGPIVILWGDAAFMRSL